MFVFLFVLFFHPVAHPVIGHGVISRGAVNVLPIR